MKNTVFYLPSCDSCRKIIKAISPKAQLVYHDIKQDPLTELQLQELHALAGSYEALFSRKAQLYKAYNLKNQTLTEADYKKWSKGRDLKSWEVEYKKGLAALENEEYKQIIQNP